MFFSKLEILSVQVLQAPAELDLPELNLPELDPAMQSRTKSWTQGRTHLLKSIMRTMKGFFGM